MAERLDGQIGFEDIDDSYRAFVDKFKPKKTTDDFGARESTQM